MRWFAVLVLALASVHASALELFKDGKFVTEAQRGYQVQSGDTLGGYVIYRPSEATLTQMGVSKATGGMFDMPIPWAVFVYADNRQWEAIQTLVVSVGADETNAWLGDPCDGASVAKINRVRGYLDRCAVARFKPLELGDQTQTVLELVFVESNTGGRRYELHFLLNMNAGGMVSQAVLTDDKSAPHAALKAWMGTMLDAVVLAAGHQKPVNAFEGVPAPWTVLRQ